MAGDITANPFVNGAMRWRYGISTSVTSNNLTVEAMRLEIQGS